MAKAAAQKRQIQSGDSLPHVTELLTQKIATLSRALDRQAEGTLAERTDMTVLESRMLAFVAANGPLSITDLASGMFIDFGQTSRLISRLVNLGYVARTKNAGDQRSVLLKLSQKGVTAYNRMQRSVLRWNHILMAQLRPEELHVLADVLPRLTTFVGNYSRQSRIE